MKVKIHQYWYDSRLRNIQRDSFIFLTPPFLHPSIRFHPCNKPPGGAFLFPLPRVRVISTPLLPYFSFFSLYFFSAVLFEEVSSSTTQGNLLSYFAHFTPSFEPSLLLRSVRGYFFIPSVVLYSVAGCDFVAMEKGVEENNWLLSCAAPLYRI